MGDGEAEAQEGGTLLARAAATFIILPALETFWGSNDEGPGTRPGPTTRVSL